MLCLPTSENSGANRNFVPSNERYRKSQRHQMASSPPSGQSQMERVRAHAVSNGITDLLWSVIGRWQRLDPSNDRNDINSQRHQLGSSPPRGQSPIPSHTGGHRSFLREMAYRIGKIRSLIISSRTIPNPITHQRSLAPHPYVSPVVVMISFSMNSYQWKTLAWVWKFSVQWNIFQMSWVLLCSPEEGMQWLVGMPRRNRRETL